jgi:hypothetical protein
MYRKVLKCNTTVRLRCRGEDNIKTDLKINTTLARFHWLRIGLSSGLF